KILLEAVVLQQVAQQEGGPVGVGPRRIARFGSKREGIQGCVLRSAVQAKTKIGVEPQPAPATVVTGWSSGKIFIGTQAPVIDIVAGPVLVVGKNIGDGEIHVVVGINPGLQLAEVFIVGQAVVLDVLNGFLIMSGV